MRSSVQSINSSRSLALQQYDAEKKAAVAATGVAAAPAGPKPKAPGPTAASQARAAAQQCDEDWTLCGWEDGPSVPVAARVASAKLRKHQPAALLTAPCSPQAPPAGSSSSGNRCSSAGRGRVAAAGSSSSPKRRTTHQGPRALPGSHPPKQQLCPAVRRLQLGEEDSFETAAEHYRPPAAAAAEEARAAAAASGTVAVLPGTAAAACAGAGDAGGSSSSSDGGSSTGRSCVSEAAMRDAVQDTSSAAGSCHLPSLYPHAQQPHHQRQQHTAHGAAAPADQTGSAPGCSLSPAAGGQRSLEHNAPNLQQPTTACTTVDPTGGFYEDDSALYAPTGSPAAPGWGCLGSLLLPSTHSRGLLHSTTTTSTSSINSNIIALHQRLLLHQPPPGLLNSGSSNGGGSSGSSSGLPVGCRSSTGLPLAGYRSWPGAGSAGLLMQGANALGQLGPAAAAAGSALHARMATTAARAQMLLTRDLSCLVPPHAPRDRPTLVAAPPAADSDACSSLDAQHQQEKGEQQQEGFDAAAGSSLRFLNSSRCGSRPSSATKGRAASGSSSSSNSGTGSGLAAGAAANAAAAGIHDSRAAAAAADAQRAAGFAGASRQGSDDSTGAASSSSGRPSTSSSTSGSNPGFLSQAPSKGLSAAAEYMACRATVGQLLQRINRHKAAAAAMATQQALQRLPAGPSCAVSAAAVGGPAGLSASRAAVDTVFSRDGGLAGPAAAAGGLGKVPAKQLLGLPVSPLTECCTSLRAYQAFQAANLARGPDSSSSGSSPNTGSGGSSRPNSGGHHVGSRSSGVRCSPGHHSLLKSISAGSGGGSSTASGGGGHLGGLVGSGFELRATASLRKCGSSKQ